MRIRRLKFYGSNSFLFVEEEFIGMGTYKKVRKRERRTEGFIKYWKELDKKERNPRWQKFRESIQYIGEENLYLTYASRLMDKFNLNLVEAAERAQQELLELRTEMNKKIPACEREKVYYTKLYRLLHK